MRRSCTSILKAIASAQNEFRQKDLDSNGRSDYWRADVAGLHYLTSIGVGGEAQRLKLVVQSVALSDACPVVTLPNGENPECHYGYWFKAILHHDEDVPSPDRFAIVAYPAKWSTADLLFVIDETGECYAAETKAVGVVDRYPSPEELNRKWRVVIRDRNFQELAD